MPRADLIFFDAGGGHRSAATALRLALNGQEKHFWEVRLVNLQETLDPLDIFRKTTGVRLQDIYNLMLKNGWTLGSPQLTRWMQALIRFYHPAQVRLLEGYWRDSRPDLVVSLVPHFNRALCEGLRRAWPSTPFVTILTDLADYPPHFWIERQEQFLICGSERAVEQARAMGHPEQRIFRTSGMILHPRFYEPIRLDRCAEQRKLGLQPAVPTGLVMFGGAGSKTMLKVAERLDRSGLYLQLILICGRNQKLAEKLRRYQGRIAMRVEGFTSEVPYYMHLSDFFIGKPGPGSISEALEMNLPVIVESNAWTLPQERYNAEWVLEKGVGLVVRSFREIEGTVEELLRHVSEYGSRAAAVQSRAIFEIPEILWALVSGSEAKRSLGV